MTLDGARKALKGERVVATVERSVDIELLDSLYSLKSKLIAVRDSLGEEQVAQQAVVAGKEESSTAQSEEQPKRPVYLEQTLFDF